MFSALIAIAALASAPAEGAPSIVHTEPRSAVLTHTALAILPGAVIPGLGHSLSGDAPTAHRLRLLSGVSLAGAALGGGVLYLSGGSDKVAPFVFPLLIGGGSVFGICWLADVLGTARPSGWATPLHDEERLALSLQAGPSSDRYSPVRRLGLLQGQWQTRHALVDGWAALAPGTPYHEVHLRAGPKLWSG